MLRHQLANDGQDTGALGLMRSVALQLRFLFEMRFLCCGLMSAPPERPRDDIGGLNALSRETLGYAADFLDRPTDEIGCFGVALDLVFLGGGLLA